MNSMTQYSMLQAFELEKQLSKEAKEARALAIKFKDQTSGWIAAACRCEHDWLTCSGAIFSFVQT